MNKFCTQCGSPLDANNKFCFACGASISGAPRPTALAAPVQAKSSAPRSAGKPRRTLAATFFSVVRTVVLRLSLALLVRECAVLWIGYHESHEVLPTSQRDPCSIVPKQEIESALGSSFQRMEANPLGCEYYTPAASNWVRLEFHWGEGVAYMAALRSAGKMFSMSTKPVSGVGDEAYFDAGENTFSVRKKDNVLTIDLRFYPKSALEKGKSIG